ncbi:ABC transporter ATP-binding protein [Treponema sp.]|uniref:ATP-binding cassette domain-containing protein n=1 Tax=Treponema sp. TaxID=166 RepID=UPI0025D6592B|nr:ABC transporter ATP-binding protein [Treponema sp.]MCR5218718.1 ABC transporter ATP-binding protein [Treponema sp.]
MSLIKFNDVSFSYIDDENTKLVFDHFTAELPEGFVSLTGPNGSGKSTFLLLASGRIIPQNGFVELNGKKIAALDETEKNLEASVIYQNMEFESEDKVEELLKTVYKNGNYKGSHTGIKDSSQNLYDEVISVFELTNVLKHGLKEISKGEIQRTLLAFSILYGSRSIFMDEPLFAMEAYQKEAALEYLSLYCKKNNISIYISMHELDLTKKYAQTVMLFYPNRDISMGSPEEVLTDEDLEKAYGFPANLLKNKEDMTRESLIQTSDAILKVQQNSK